MKKFAVENQKAVANLRKVVRRAVKGVAVPAGLELKTRDLLAKRLQFDCEDEKSNRRTGFARE